MTSAIAAHGIQLQIGDGGGPEVFATVAEVTNVSGPGLTLETADVTSHSSTNGWREFIGTVKDGGEVTLDINYVPTNATHKDTTGLVGLLKNKTVRNMKVVFPDSGSTTWTFTALVTKFEPGAPVDEALTATVTVKITGSPTLV